MFIYGAEQETAIFFRNCKSNQHLLQIARFSEAISGGENPGIPPCITPSCSGLSFTAPMQNIRGNQPARYPYTSTTSLIYLIVFPSIIQNRCRNIRIYHIFQTLHGLIYRQRYVQYRTVKYNVHIWRRAGNRNFLSQLQVKSTSFANSKIFRGYLSKNPYRHNLCHKPFNHSLQCRPRATIQTFSSWNSKKPQFPEPPMKSHQIPQDHGKQRKDKKKKNDRNVRGITTKHCRN